MTDRLAAIIFDVDGTLAETEEAHRAAFNQAFSEAGYGWVWTPDDYRRLLGVTGGKERIRQFLDAATLDATDKDIEALHRRKNAIYADRLKAGAVALRPGVARLIDECSHAGIGLAIATTTSRANMLALLSALFGSEAPDWLAVVVAGEDVVRKKPDPEVYRRAVEALGLPVSGCIAIEDSRNGLDAALGCGLATVVTPSVYTSHEQFAGAALVCSDLDNAGTPIDVDRLARILSSRQRRLFEAR
ncbi:HAD-IA family hydrolase [Glacieibacterium sp.]|uniref:HAD-IA family hydrolase n=1 Tax=Glacieibacterium sp. TaxID=2860237 RepID=UPI003AFF61F7